MSSPCERSHIEASAGRRRRSAPRLNATKPTHEPRQELLVDVAVGIGVRTRIGESGRNRPARYGQSQPLDPASPAAAIVAEIARNIDAGLAPDAVAARVLAAIRDDELYIFAHPGMQAEVEGRFAAILAAMDAVSPP